MARVTTITLRLTTADERRLARLEELTGVHNWCELVRLAIARLEAEEAKGEPAEEEGDR